MSDVVYKFQCGLCNESYYGECLRHLAVRSCKHIGISPLTNKRIQPTIPDKVFGAKWNNLVKLDRKRKVWYVFLRVF